MIGCATMKNTFALSILRPLTRLLRICCLILTGVLSGWASAESATNGVLTIIYFADTSLYGVEIGSNHPNPSETVTYAGASYFTVRDYTRGVDYTNNARSDPDTTTGKLSQLMGKGTVVALSDRGFRSTWVLPNFTVIQEVEILGSTLADTSVREQDRKSVV